MSTARLDVERQKLRDRDFDVDQDALHARIKAVLGAEQAVVEREVGAAYALRQSLIDLAAAAELVAEGLPPRSSRREPPPVQA